MITNPTLSSACGATKTLTAQKVLKFSCRLLQQKGTLILTQPYVMCAQPRFTHPDFLSTSPECSRHAHAHPTSTFLVAGPPSRPPAQLLPQSPDRCPCLQPSSCLTLPHAATKPVPTDAPLCPIHQLGIFIGPLESTQILKLGI